MELIVKGSFYRDLINYSDSKVLQSVYRVLQDISVAGDYWMGIVVRGDTVWLVRFCHRSIFYKQFP